MKVLLLLLFSSLTFASKQFICPNNGTPKVGDDGEEIQCLPGQAAELVCGRGYSCFFSGFNYRCCPTAEEDYDDNLHGTDCPLGSLNVLDSRGAPVRCNPRTGRCQNSKQFCSRKNSNAVCCENITKVTPPSNTRTTQEEIQETTTKPTKNQKTVTPDILDLLELECPGNALTVLSDIGEPFACKANKDCPTSSMKCEKVNDYSSICCESLQTAKNNLDEEPIIRDLKSDEPNPLKYTPTDAAKIKDELQIQKEIESAIVGNTNKAEKIEKLTSIETVKQPKKDHKKPRNYADNENTRRISFKATRRPHIHENPEPRRPKAFGIQTHTAANSEKKVIVEYQPHSQGGYAISRKLQKVNSRVLSPERKALAQEYIVNQIRQGWPYDDKFYRPENIALLKNGRRTEAVLHFPN